MGLFWNFEDVLHSGFMSHQVSFLNYHDAKSYRAKVTKEEQTDLVRERGRHMSAIGRL